jgi:hypothetical protein
VASSVPFTQLFPRVPLIVGRLLGTVLAAAGFLTLTAAPAHAKIPPFTIEVQIDGDSAIITVRIGGLGGSQTSVQGFDPPNLDNLVSVYPAGALDDRGRPRSHVDAIPADLIRVEHGVYQGVVTVDTPGQWAVVPFPASVSFDPGTPIHDAYPHTTVFDIRKAGFSSWTWPALGMGASSVGLLLFGRRPVRAAKMRRQERSPQPF